MLFLTEYPIGVVEEKDDDACITYIKELCKHTHKDSVYLYSILKNNSNIILANTNIVNIPGIMEIAGGLTKQTLIFQVKNIVNIYTVVSIRKEAYETNKYTFYTKNIDNIDVDIIREELNLAIRKIILNEAINSL